MGLRINTNIQALAGQRNLSNNFGKLQQSLERLSSGSRINKAADDAAGLGISEKLKANIRSLGQATRNANDGISLIQTAEGSMNEISNILVRIRELSIQAASDTIGDPEREFVDKEVQHLKFELDRIANSTEYNGTKLLNGQSEPLEIQVGVNNNPVNDRLTFESQNQVTTLESLGITDVSTIKKVNAQENLEKIDKAIHTLNSNRASLGALQNRLNSTINNLRVYNENLSAANSRIRDTDMAEEATTLTKSNILTQSNIAVLAQANQTPTLALSLLG